MCHREHADVIVMAIISQTAPLRARATP